MHDLSRRAAILSALALAACGRRRDGGPSPEGGSPAMRRLVDHYADLYDVPRSLVHRVVKRESGYRAEAQNGPYFGLMQIHPRTAQTMGFDGPPEALLDADTNLRYGVKYLRGAWLVADGSEDKAIYWYSRGYYYEAKRRGLLDETGLRG